MKSASNILILVTTLFIGMLLGIYISRNFMGETIHVSVPAAMQTMPTEPAERVQSTKEEPAAVFPIRLNQATKEDLMALPNIGETLANRILDYRKAYGAFSSVEELLNIEGIGKDTMEQLWGLIALN